MENSKTKYFSQLSKEFFIDSPFKGDKMSDKNKEEKYVSANLKSSTIKSLSKIKEAIISSRKSKMRIQQHYLCDVCDKNILRPADGFVIQGNIYTADPNITGGLIGNNFPEPDEKNMVNLDAVKHTVLCKDCFCRALGLSTNESKYNIKKKESNYYW